MPAQDDVSRKEFLEQHAKILRLQTLYTKYACTWETDHTHVVLIQNRIVPQQGKLYSYSGYMNNLQEEECFIENNSGPHFNFMRQIHDGESLFTSVYKRFFGGDYTDTVFISRDQEYVAIQRTKDQGQTTETKTKAVFYDIFQGFNEEKFFGQDGKAAGHFKISNKDEYVATLNPSTQFEKSRLTFSSDKKHCALFSDDGFELFDISFATDKPENSDGNQQNVKSFFKMDMKETVTYDRFLCLYLGDSSDIYKNSWAVFQSKTFNTVQFVKLQNCKDFRDEQEKQKKIEAEQQDKKKEQTEFFFFGKSENPKLLINSQNQDLVKFWKKTVAVFSKDGTIALLKTLNDTYYVQVVLPADKKPEKRVSVIKSLYGQETTIFRHNENDFTIMEQGKEIRKFTFCHTSPKTVSSLVKKSIDIKQFCTKNLKILEARVNAKTGTCRAIGVRGCDEVFIWEQKENQTQNQFFEELYPTNLSALSKPYFAYSCGGNEVLIVPLYENNLTISFRLQLDQNEEIQKLVFSKKSDLFIITRTVMRDNQDQLRYLKFFVHKLQVKNDFASKIQKKAFFIQKDLKKEIAEKFVNKLESILHIEKNSDKKSKNSLKYMERRKSENGLKKISSQKFGPFSLKARELGEYEADIDEIFVCDQELGATNRLDLVIYAELKIYFLSFLYNNDDGISFENEQKLTQIEEGSIFQSLSKMNDYFYIYKTEKGQSLKSILILNSQENFRLDTLYTESSYELLHFQTDEKKIYVLCKDMSNYYIRVFILRGNNAVQQTSFITLNFQDSLTAQFILSFFTAKFLIDGIVIHDANIFSRIYDAGKCAGVTHFQNYLPSSSSKDRSILQSQIIQSRYDRLLGLITSYTNTNKNKIAMILPYLNDNAIKLDPETQQISWIAKASIKETHRIFQLKTNKWKLQEYNLAGICIKATYYTELKNQHILALQNNSPKFLVSRQSQDFLKKLVLYEILVSHELKEICQWETQDLYCNKISLYDKLLKYYKTKGMTFKFSINSFNDIAIGCFFQDSKSSSQTLQNLLLIPKQKEEKAGTGKFFKVLYKVDQIDMKSQTKFSELKTDDKKTQLKEPLLKEGQYQYKLKNSKEASTFKKKLISDAIGFTLSESKIILWNKTQIFYQDLIYDKGKESGTIELKQSEFELFQNPKRQIEVSNLELSIQSILTRTQQIKDKDKQKNTDVVQIKILDSNNASMMMSFDLEKGQELNSLSSTKEAEFFYDTFDNCYIYDQQGIQNLHSGETYNEYHIKKGVNESIDYQLNPGVDWGERMVPTKWGMFLVIENKLILPYSYLSIVQNQQTISQNHKSKQQVWYTDDYYKFKGQTTFHKYKNDTVSLEKIFECYWKQDRRFISGLLVRTELFQEIAFEDFQTHKTELLTQRAYKNSIPGFEQKENEFQQEKAGNNKSLNKESASKSQLKKVGVENEQLLNYKIEYGQTIIDELVNLSHDRLINQILFMLSRLPRQNSFKLLMTNFAGLCNFLRFPDHLNIWFEQTLQLQEISLIYTELEQGFKEYKSNYSLLESKFFKEYPIDQIQDSEEIDQSRNFSCFSFCRSSQKKKKMMPVRISVMPTLWMFEDENKPFFKQLLEMEDVSLFANPNIQAMIRFQQDIFYQFYVTRVFLPFLLLSYIPISAIALINQGDDDDKNDDDKIQIPFYANFAYLSLAFYLLWSIYLLIKQIIIDGIGLNQKIRTIFELAKIGVIIMIFAETFDIGTFFTQFIFGGEKLVQTFRVTLVWTILVQNILLVHYIKFFDFFATFVRSLNLIIRASAPLGTTLFFFIIAQSFMFYVLAQSNDITREKCLQSENDQKSCSQLPFLDSLAYSYLLVIGDFGITEFFDESPHKMTFWMIFVFFTLLQILIILNMVIAVMSAAFDKAQATDEANIYKEKLQTFENYFFAMKGSFIQAYKQYKYLYLLEIDPVITELGATYEVDLPEQQMNYQIRNISEATQRLFIEIYSLKSSIKMVQKNQSETGQLLKSNQEMFKQE